MDTVALRLFVLAAEKLNISAAGRDLGMAPAVATAKLAKLEKTLGADLLHRSTRKVALSTEGAEFLPFAQEILAQENAGRAALGQGSSEITGTLRFAAPSSFAQTYIVPLLPDFLSRHPRLALDLKFSDSQFNLIEGSFDLALRAAALADTTLKGRKLAADLRVLAAAPDYLAQHGTPETPEDLAQHAVIAFRDRKPRGLITAQGQEALFDTSGANCQMIFDDGQSHRLATMAGAGIAANALWSIYEDLKAGRLVRVLPDYALAEETGLWLIYPQANVLSPKVRAFMDFLLERIGRRPPWEAG
ncbi:LysR family transcriptional regulator [Dinoroseobacter sp. S76]|uniref:LysR family transcriptional regulator n=1 Tax=Dinoroseobacter sp. S76 TaxID=3415124 RepID=UPI003C7BFF51